MSVSEAEDPGSTPGGPIYSLRCCLSALVNCNSLGSMKPWYLLYVLDLLAYFF